MLAIKIIYSLGIPLEMIDNSLDQRVRHLLFKNISEYDLCLRYFGRHGNTLVNRKIKIPALKETTFLQGVIDNIKYIFSILCGGKFS